MQSSEFIKVAATRREALRLLFGGTGGAALGYPIAKVDRVAADMLYPGTLARITKPEIINLHTHHPTVFPNLSRRTRLPEGDIQKWNQTREATLNKYKGKPFVSPSKLERYSNEKGFHAMSQDSKYQAADNYLNLREAKVGALSGVAGGAVGMFRALLKNFREAK